ncbi:hypothetical protein GA0074695_2532 [Micromonospora viridifaciens]|uniref:Uncharacterized protein n=1 Tax=Micromonospora viridifaciens TaxID=1881 RepID=A0A1C4WKM5_MICVI|nr:hypothetical protein GA0074695_2532 [Micromonospora viridifaciens]
MNTPQPRESPAFRRGAEVKLASRHLSGMIEVRM